jgi:peptide methionine sulfoxide reductase msrA/msrB
MLENPNDHIKFDTQSLKEIYLAGGCFWGTDAYIKRVKGVYKTLCGYANGNTVNPSYEQVCRENTGHAETVKVTYDTRILSLNELLSEFFGIINPTTLNMQGGDMGEQYRTGIYYTNPDEKPVIEAFVQSKQKDYNKPIVTEVEALDNFYEAEEYHQNYLDKNPNGYCHVDLSRYKR